MVSTEHSLVLSLTRLIDSCKHPGISGYNSFGKEKEGWGSGKDLKVFKRHRVGKS